MKYAIRLKSISILLILVTLFGVACASYPEDSADTTLSNPSQSPSQPSGEQYTPIDTTAHILETTAIPVDTTALTVTEQPQVTTYPGESLQTGCPHLPPSPYYEQEISVLYWSDRQHEEFISESISGEMVNDAIYNRNTNLQERIGITQKFIPCLGNASNATAWQQYITRDVAAGMGEFDVAAGYSLAMASTSVLGVFKNLLDPRFNQLNLEHPWWMIDLTREATINDRLFFVSGDISLNATYMMYACYVNQDMLGTPGLENVSALVAGGEWTYDKMIQMSNGVYSDLNNNKTKDLGDRFGYMTSGIHTDPWFYGSGATILENKNGTLEVSASFNGDAAAMSLDKAASLLWRSNDGLYTTSTSHQVAEFAAGRLLFMTDYIDATLDLEGSNVKYCVVPFPKYDINQADYVTVMGNPFTLFSVSQCNEDTDLPMLSAYLEVLASESYSQLTPAAYERAFKSKYDADSEQKQMFSVIRDSIQIDAGRLFSSELFGQGIWRTAMANSEGTADTWFKSCLQYEKAFKKSLDTFIGKYNTTFS